MFNNIKRISFWLISDKEYSFSIEKITLIKIVLSLISIILVSRISIFPSTSNDSIAYLNFSRDFEHFGTIFSGFRQFGYPAFIKFSYVIASFLKSDPLFTVALFQRILFIVSIVYIISLFEIKAIPILFVLSYPSYIANTNMFYPESILCSLSIIMFCTLFQYYKIKKEKHGKIVKRAILYVVSCICFLCLLFIKFQYSVFGIMLFVVYVYSIINKDTLSNFILISLVTTTVVSTVFTLIISKENLNEYGVFFPTINIERTYYAAAYFSIFNLRPENRKNDDLKEFYDKGAPWDYMQRMDKNNSNIKEKSKIYNQRIIEMYNAAGVSLMYDRFLSFLSCLYGGRINDVNGLLNNVLWNNEYTKIDGIFKDYYTKKYGVKQMLASYNNDLPPRRIDGLSGAMNNVMPINTFQRNLFILFLIMLIISFRYIYSTPFLISAIVCFIIVAVANSWFVAAFWRYLMGGWLIFALSIIASVSLLVENLQVRLCKSQ